MTGLVAVLCLGVAAGWVARSELAAVRLRELCRARRPPAAAVAVHRRRRPHGEQAQGHGWLLGAAVLAARQLLPGETVTEILVGASCGESPDQVIVTVRRDGDVTRQVGIDCCSGTGEHALTWVQADLPDPGSPAWRPG